MNGTSMEQRYLALIERNRGRVARLCHAWSRSAADREDLLAEVQLQLWRSLPSFDGRSGEDTWLYRVALNTAMLFGRRERGRRQRNEAYERELPPPAPPKSPSDRLADRERLERLLGALAKLEPGDRALVTLQLEELPQRKIAEITGLTEGHVAVRLHRIRTKLARLMSDERGSRHDGRRSQLR